MAVFPLIPWTGGLNLKQNPTLADPSQLVQADDVVYDFDGTRHKRGGQQHRNRVPTLGGKLDDHMTQSPPGDWASSGALPLTLVSSTEWRGTTSTPSISRTLTRTYSPKFSAALTVRVKLKTTEILTSGAYLGFTVNPGSTGTVDQLAVRFSAEGVKLLTAAATYSIISTSIGTFNEMALPLGGRELYETTQFHTWRFDLTAARTVLIYFDEILIFTSNALTNGASAKDGTASLVWVSGDTIDALVDSFEVNSGGEESVITALFDFPRPGANRRTTHRLIAVSNGRVHVDHGSHVFSGPILDRQDGATAQTLFDFASFDGRLVIARTGDKVPMIWDVGGAQAEALEGSPPHISMLRVHSRRLFGAGDPRFPSRLYWSGLGNPEIWTTEFTGDFVDSGFTDIDKDDGGILTAISPSLHGDLILYKTTGVFRLRGTDFDNFSLDPIFKFVLGGVPHHAVTNVLNDQYFVTSYGVHSLLATQKYGDLEQALLSNDLRDDWNTYINPDLLQYAWAVNNERFDRYELLLPRGVGGLGRYPNRIFCLHYGLTDELHPSGRWSMKLIQGGSMIPFLDEDGSQHIFIGGMTGFVNRQDERFHHDFPSHKATGTQVSV